MNISSVVKTAKSVITANSPVLLVGTAIAGVVATGVLAAKGGYKARGIIDTHEEETGEECQLTEKIQLTWLCYASPVLTATTTVASIIGVHTIHTKRHAALAGLYAIASTKMDEYSTKAEELLGPKKAQQLNNSVAQSRIDAVSEDFVNNEVIITDQGTELCYDEWSGRWFMGSFASIESAAKDINMKLAQEGEASLNDFYDKIGLPPIPMGVEFGWAGNSSNDLITLSFGSTTAPNGKPAISFWFQTSPKDGHRA